MTTQALRIALHAGGFDELLPANDYGDDLYDGGLIQVDPDDDAYSCLTQRGADTVRLALLQGAADKSAIDALRGALRNQCDQYVAWVNEDDATSAGYAGVLWDIDRACRALGIDANS